MITLDKFEGHLVLYCKNHYTHKDVDFLTGLKRIWAVRCGFGNECIDNSILEYIANALYKTLKKVNPNKMEYLFEVIHKEVSKTYLSQYKGLSTIETLIMIYRNELAFIQVKETTESGDYRTLIELPKPMKRVFNRIVKGEAKEGDYYLISK